MKPNQSIHISVKQPPNPAPVKTLGVFETTANPNIPSLVSAFLSGIPSPPKDAEFLQNVREEAIKAITLGTVLTVMRTGNLLTITVEEKNA